jgi:amino acid transporter
VAGLMLNAILGAGVYGLPTLVSGKLGGLAWAGVLLAGVVITVVVACFAEVSSRFGDTGGPYLYVKTAFGPYVGLVVGWLHYLTRLASAASIANLFIVYLAGFFPALTGFTAKAIVVTLALGVIAAVNCRGVKQGARLSNWLIVIKILPLVLFASVGLGLALARGPVEPVHVGTPPLSAWVEAVLVLVFAYGGFESGIIAMGEAKHPERDGAFALVIAIVGCTILYTLVQAVATLTLADPAAHPRAVADAARVLLGPIGATVMALGALLSTAGWFTGATVATPRLTYAMAQAGVLPKVFGWLHPIYRTPVFSIIAFAALSVVLAMSAGFVANVTLSVISRLGIYGLVCLALPVLRRREGRDPSVRPALFRLPGGMVFAAIGVGLSAALATRITVRETIIMAVVIGLATINWLITRGGAGAAGRGTAQ